MYFKHGYHQFRKNITMNVFIMIQMMVVLFTVVCMTSVIMDVYRYYQMLEPYFSKEGWLYHVYNVVIDNRLICSDSDELEAVLNKADVAACYDAEGLACKLKTGTRYGSYRIYDHELTTAYTPDMEEGLWLGQTEAEDGIIPVVISHNDYGIHTGDVFELAEQNNGPEEYRWTAKVVGVLKDGASIIGWTDSDINNDGDYMSLYSSYTLGEQGKPIFLMDMDAVKQAEKSKRRHFPKTIGNVLIIGYAEDITMEDAAENDSILWQYVNYYMQYSMREVRENSMTKLKNSLYGYLTIFIGAFILMLISTISISTIVIRQQLETYAVFHICGMNPAGCIWINQISTLLTTGIALCATGLLGVILRITGIVEETVITFGFLQLMGCITVLAVYLLVSATIPPILAGHRQIKEILTENRK